MRNAKQCSFPFARARPKRPVTGTPHRARSSHCRRHPLHVTLRRADLLPNLRHESLFLAIRRALGQTARTWFRVVHFSVQTNHVHMIVEAHDNVSLARGMIGLSVRIARACNRVLRRRGAVWRDRYHARALKTPREVRIALIYVLMNHRKHVAIDGVLVVKGFDACSSAWWFDGWAHPPSSGPPSPVEGLPVTRAETWLATEGWKRFGLLRIDESPRGRSR